MPAVVWLPLVPARAAAPAAPPPQPCQVVDAGSGKCRPKTCLERDPLCASCKAWKNTCSACKAGYVLDRVTRKVGGRCQVGKGAAVGSVANQSCIIVAPCRARLRARREAGAPPSARVALPLHRPLLQCVVAGSVTVPCTTADANCAACDRNNVCRQCRGWNMVLDAATKKVPRGSGL